MKGHHHNEEKNIIHLEKWIKFEVDPPGFNRKLFINANKQWLCENFYDYLKQYLDNAGYGSVKCMEGFLDVYSNAPYPCGIIYINEIPIRWTFGSFLGHPTAKKYAMYADFIGYAIKEEIK